MDVIRNAAFSATYHATVTLSLDFVMVAVKTEEKGIIV